MPIKKRLFIGISWMFAGNWSEQVVNFFVFVILARILGAEAFGLATMALVFVAFAEFLVRQTLTETIIQQKKLESAHLNAIFILLAFFSIFLVALLIFLAEHIANMYSEPRVAYYLIFASPTILFIGFSGVPATLLKRKLEFKVLAIRATVGVIVGGLVGITLALLDYGVWSFIAQHVVKILVNNILVWIANPWKPKWDVTRKHFKDVIGFSTQMIGLRVTEIISINTPMVIIGAYLGPSMLGQYTIAWRLIDVLANLLITPIQFVAQPAFAHINRASETAGQMLAKITSTTAIITFASFLGMASVSTPLINLLFDNNWTDATQAHQILCLVGIYLTIERMQQAFCLALGKASSLFYISLAEALIGIIIIFLFVESGISSVAAAFAIRYLIMWPFRFKIVSELADSSPFQYLKGLRLPFFNAILMTLIVVAWQQWLDSNTTSIVLLTGSIFIGIVSYSALTWITMRNQIQELVISMKSFREEAN